MKIHELTHPRHVDIVTAEAGSSRLSLHSEARSSKYRHPEKDIDNRSQHGASYKILEKKSDHWNNESNLTLTDLPLEILAMNIPTKGLHDTPQPQ